jgi:hypothetical protein
VAIVAVLGGLALAAAPAWADTVPEITEPPQVAGTAQEDETLEASAAWTGDPEPKAKWFWLRCTATGTKCKRIAGATGATYRPTTDDVGLALRAHLKLVNAAGTVEARSEPTAAVEAAPEPPPDSSPPPPTDPDDPDDPDDPPAVPGPHGSSRPPLLDPFPVIRIRGRLTADGARVTRLSVRAPVGARIVASCRGHSCPAHKLARTAGIRLHRFERELRTGTRLVITVTKPGYIGKWTSIVVRRGAAPRRKDRCVYPGAHNPVQCPAT